MDRKRAALSQDEVAFLLGMNGGAKICRHERRSRAPTLETALAYEALYGVPVSELHAGVYGESLWFDVDAHHSVSFALPAPE